MKIRIILPAIVSALALLLLWVAGQGAFEALQQRKIGRAHV